MLLLFFSTNTHAKLVMNNGTERQMYVWSEVGKKMYIKSMWIQKQQSLTETNTNINQPYICGKKARKFSRCSFSLEKHFMQYNVMMMITSKNEQQQQQQQQKPAYGFFSSLAKCVLVSVCSFVIDTGRLNVLLCSIARNIKRKNILFSSFFCRLFLLFDGCWSHTRNK